MTYFIDHIHFCVAKGLFLGRLGLLSGYWANVRHPVGLCLDEWVYHQGCGANVSPSYIFNVFRDIFFDVLI